MTRRNKKKKGKRGGEEEKEEFSILETSVDSDDDVSVINFSISRRDRW